MAVKDETMIVRNRNEEQNVASMILEDVYHALVEKGYNPVDQIAGYLLSGDPAYITSHNNARSNICLLYTSPSPRDRQKSRMPSSA